MPSPQTKKPKRPSVRRVAIPVALVTLLILGSSFLLLGYAAAAEGRVLNGVHVAGIDLSSRTLEEARDLLGQSARDALEHGLTFTAEGKSVTFEATVPAKSGIDTAYPLFNLDVESATNLAYALGREGNTLVRLISLFRSVLGDRQLAFVNQADEERLLELLKESFGPLAHAAEDAHFAVNSTGTLSVTPERSGRNFNYSAVIAAARQRLAELSTKPIAFSLVDEFPRVKAAGAQVLLAPAQAIVNRAPFTLTFGEKTWTLDKATAAEALDIVIQDGKAAVAFTPAKLTSLFDEIAKAVDEPAQDVKFGIKGTRVVEFKPAKSGREFNRVRTAEEMNSRLIAAESSQADAIVREIPPSVTESEGANLGITELVGLGQTSFAGSPQNRRKNIANGARLLHGLLIKPREEFSLLKALAPFETSNGYLPELVIKGDRTIPEIGGGLCQIGTTTFRLVLDSGLPILERRNHSYRVSYYEPPVGMDATIYEPKPDFRFVNDYSSHLLLQTRIEGDNLIFEFYGTKDGRVAATSKPRVWNAVKPGPTKIIETTDLKPGEKKCIERAHVGSDAEFTYTVTYPDSQVKQEVFRSHYKPWQEVCLLGVEKKLEPKEEDVVPEDTGAIGT